MYLSDSLIKRIPNLVGLGALLLLLSSNGMAQSQNQSAPAVDLTTLSIEDLMSVKVKSVSKKDQTLSRTASAVFVITREDIRTSGATTMPDVLRIVPGVHVAQLNANIWVISIRGFSDRFADKVLVLIDGRTVYTPTSSGVYWDQQDLPLEDIERIEVIRGPGGTIWGANAVDGVISITTRSATNTLGALASITASSRETFRTLAQWGDRAGNDGAYRIFGQYYGTGSLPLPGGTDGGDGWHLWHSGFRIDSGVSKKNSITVQGDALRTTEGETVNLVLANNLPQQPTFASRTSVSAGNLLARWTRQTSGDSAMALQAYYDGYDRHEEGGYEGRRTLDIDFQDHLPARARQDVVWGVGYRVTSDNLTPKYSKSYNPAQRTDNLFSAFAQDEVRLTGALHLIPGARLEHNGYTGFEFEPSAQLDWTPTNNQSLWVSASRAIRQPARADTAIQIDLAIVPLSTGGFGVKQVTANPNRKAEELIAYQLGYRAEISRRLTFDLATFWNHYHHLQTDEPGTPFFTQSPGPPHEVFPLTSSDMAHAHSYGAEALITCGLTKWWRLTSGYAYLHMAVEPDPSSLDTSVSGIAGDSPEHSYSIRSQIALPRNFEWDTSYYFVGALPDQAISAYSRLDARVSWHRERSLELSVTGQNLLTPQHEEFGDDTPLHTLMQRKVAAQIRWYFKER